MPRLAKTPRPSGFPPLLCTLVSTQLADSYRHPRGLPVSSPMNQAIDTSPAHSPRWDRLCTLDLALHSKHHNRALQDESSAYVRR